MDRYERAKRGLDLMNTILNGVMNGVQQHVVDVKAIAKQALNDKEYSADKLVPDMLALWLNAAAAATEVLAGGRPVDDDGAGNGGGGGGAGGGGKGGGGGGKV